MKFLTELGGVATIHADQRTACECYVAGLRLTPTITSAKRDVTQMMVAMIDLDPRINDEVRMEPRDTIEEGQLGAEGQNTQLGRSLTPEESQTLKTRLADNKDLFAWTVGDMPGIDSRVMTHKLSVCKEARPIAQK